MPPVLKNLIVYSLRGVEAGFAIAIPYIAVFYAILSIFEDSGYLTRAAFLLDNLTHKLGLHGRAVIPLVLGFGCNVPAIMAVHSLGTRREKRIASLLIALIPCSARTVIILGLVGTFVGFWPAVSIYILEIIIITGMAARKKLEDVKNEKNELIRTEDRLLDTLRRKSLELREIENQIRDAEAAVATSDSDTLSVRYELEKLSENLESLIRDRDDIESSHFRIKEDIRKLENRLHSLQQEYTITEARVRSSEQGGGYSRAVEMVIGAARQEDLFGIHDCLSSAPTPVRPH